MRLALLAGVLVTASSVTAQTVYELDPDSDEWAASMADVAGADRAGTAALVTARRALAEDRYEQADNLASAWIERHPDHPGLPAAHLIRADALKARGELYDALFDYEIVVKRYPGSELFITALEREYEIAERFALGEKRKLWGMRIADASETAEELLIRIQERLPGSALAERAGLALADFYFRRREMALAADMYDLFIELYPRSIHVAKARKRLIYAHLAAFKGPEFDAAGLYDARTRLRTLIAREPAVAEQIGAAALLTRIDESDAEKMYRTAAWYVEINDAVAAEFTVRRLLRRYPRSVAAARGVRMMANLVDQLPPVTRENGVDYELLEKAIRPEPAATAEQTP